MHLHFPEHKYEHCIKLASKSLFHYVNKLNIFTYLFLSLDKSENPANSQKKSYIS